MATTTTKPQTPIPPVKPPVTPTNTVNTAKTQATPSISPPPAKSGFDKFGGKDHYIESQINRWNDAVNSNDTGLMDRLQTDAYRVGYDLPGTNNYKKTDTGLGMGGTGGNGLPSDLSWLGAGANSEIAGQISAYQGQQEAARLAMQQGIAANNDYLKEQIASLQQQRAVDQDALQQQQNRFGGLYSGGLNYQGGQINSAYAQQQGNLSRDIAARNNALQQQYGSQASTIAQQIAQLQANQPALVNEKIQNYLLDYAGTFGVDPISGKSTVNNKIANLNAVATVGDLTSKVVNPQNDWGGLFRQANDPNAKLTQSAQQQAFENELATAEAEIYKQVQLGNLSIAEAKLALDDLSTKANIAQGWEQTAISRMNANTSATSAANSRNNAQIGQLMEIWKYTGVAPAGLESLGVQQGTPYAPGIEAPKETKYDYRSDPDFMADAAAMVKSPAEARIALRDNSEAYIEKYGIEGYNYLITTVNK